MSETILAEHARQTQAALYAEWKRYGHHLEEYACEGVGTAFLVFCVVAVVALMFSAGSPVPNFIPPAPLRLFLAGLLIGSSGWLVTWSPLGRLSGAHLNPAVSVGFWRLGKMHTKDMIGYVFSQMAGGVAGSLLAQAALKTGARQVHDAALTSAPSVGAAGAFGAEVATTFAMTLLIYVFVSHRRLMHWTAPAVALAAGILVCLDGQFSGAGMNPARWFGPAVATDYWRLFWVYAFAPVIGSLLAVGVRRSGLPETLPHTGKLLHDPRFRSLFKHDSVPSQPPVSVQQGGRL